MDPTEPVGSLWHGSMNVYRQELKACSSGWVASDQSIRRKL